MNSFFQNLAAVLGCLAALVSIPLFLRLRWPPSPVLFFIKLYSSALSPFLILIGIMSALVGIFTGSVFIGLLGLYDILVFFTHVFKVTRPPAFSTGFNNVFGLHGENLINPSQKNRFLSKRWVLWLPAVPNQRMTPNIPFASAPGTGRQLLCDIWQPLEDFTPSGLAFIYLHGSAWYLLDKDLGTRTFFNHLAAQGHVIMDVAYRLAPETDMMGMVNDVARAIAWMKENADAYGIDPDRIVLGGGSAGGHLALLTAYTSNNPQFTPRELQGKDLSIAAVVSLYGPTDLEACYYHTNQHLTTRSTQDRPKKDVPTQLPEWIKRRMGEDYDRLGMNKGFENAGGLAILLGGHPDECPETYALFSPVTHVHAKCPPSLLISGEHDIITPVKATRFLHCRLVEEGIPTVLHILPQTDHAFDLILPKISPSAHNAFYDLERFIALAVLKKKIENERKNNCYPEFVTTQ